MVQVQPHALQPTTASAADEVDADEVPSTPSLGDPRDPTRLLDARPRAKRIYRRAVLEESSLRKEAALLGVHHSYPGRMTDEDDDGANPSLAHILAGSRKVRRSVALQMLADADADERDEEPVSDASLPTQALVLQGDLGELSSALRKAMLDGHLDKHELEELLTCGQRLVADGNTACKVIRRLLAALDAQRPRGGK